MRKLVIVYSTRMFDYPWETTYVKANDQAPGGCATGVNGGKCFKKTGPCSLEI